MVTFNCMTPNVSALFFFITGGANACYLPKDSSKVGIALKANTSTDLVNGKGGGDQQPFCLFYPHIVQILRKREAGVFFEASGKIEFAQIILFRYAFQSEGFRIVVIDVSHDFKDRFLGGADMMGSLVADARCAPVEKQKQLDEGQFYAGIFLPVRMVVFFLHGMQQSLHEDLLLGV